MSWVDTTFRLEFAPFLNYGKRNLRRDGFAVIFNELEKTNKEYFTIVETGTTRLPLDHRLAWKDGLSTILFENFVEYYNGRIYSIDIDKSACENCRNITGSKVSVINDDSCKVLEKIEQPVDLYYLDSYDADRNNPLPSQEHHLKEFKAIEPFLQDSVVAIDDNYIINETNVGKGKLIEDYLAFKNIYPIYKGYQIVYKF